MSLLNELIQKLTHTELDTLAVILENGVHAAVKAERKEYEYYAWDSNSMREFSEEIYTLTYLIG